MKVDSGEVRRALALLADPAAHVELRALPSANSVVLGGADLDGLVQATAELAGPQDHGVYYTLNPVGKIDRQARDVDALRRRWLPVDVDRQKGEADKDLSATEEEKEAARQVALKVYAHLVAEEGWPEPVVIDSGNGWHLLWRVDLPNDDASRDLIRGFLKRLASRFNTDGADVDGKVFNAGRVMKLPGTMARKGADLPDRPHRMARLRREPRPLGVVSAEQIAAAVPSDASAAAGGGGAAGDSGSKSSAEDPRAVYAERAMAAEVTNVATAAPKTRNDTLNDAAFAMGQLVGAGAISRARVEMALRSAALGRGLPEREVEDTLKSGIEAGLLQPRDLSHVGAWRTRSFATTNGTTHGAKLPGGTGRAEPGGSAAAPPPPDWPDPVPLSAAPPAPPFPVEVFPDLVRRFVTAAASAIPTPPDFVAVPLLVMSGGALGASRAVEIKPGHYQRAALYAAVVGSPGGGKSPACELVTDPVREAEDALMAEWEERMEEYREALEEYERAKKARQRKGAEGGDGEPLRRPERPILTRYTVNNTTTEALAPILQENPRGVVLTMDELTAWVASQNQYRDGGKGADSQFWLSVWSGATATVDRKKSHELGPIRIRRPFMGVIGGLPPEKLRTLRGDRGRQRADADGFLDRVLFGYPDELPAGEETWASVGETDRNNLADALERLRSLEMVPVTKGDRVVGWRPFYVNLNPEARAGWVAWTRRHARELNAEDFPPYLKGPWAKMRGYMGRLALLVHYLRWACGEVNDDKADLDGEDMRRAALLIDYFKGQARRVYATMDADPRVVVARRLLRWLAAREDRAFTRRDAFRAARGTDCKAVEDIDPVLQMLEGHGFIRATGSDSRPGPGRKPSPGYEAHPALRDTLDRMDETPDEDEPGTDSVQSGHSVPGGDSGAEDEGGAEEEAGQEKEECAENQSTPPSHNGQSGHNPPQPLSPDDLRRWVNVGDPDDTFPAEEVL